MRSALVKSAVAAAAVGVALAGCSGGKHNNSSSTTTTQPGHATTLSIAPATTPAPTTVPNNPAGHLLDTLRTKAFNAASLPAGVHLVGVGPFTATHDSTPNLLGAAQVNVTLASPGQHIVAIYEVFGTAADATQSYTTSYNNNKEFGGAGSVVAETLSPAVEAFCATQPDNDVACEFHRGDVSAEVLSTLPAASRLADSVAMLKALLAHLVSVGG